MPTLSWVVAVQMGIIILLLVLLFRSNKKLTQTLESIIASHAPRKNEQELQSFLEGDEPVSKPSGANDLRDTLL